MKLLIITAVDAFTADIRTLLRQSNIKSYSCREVTGYKEGGEENLELNWFGTEPEGTDSVMCYAITEDASVVPFFEAVNTFNQGRDQSRIHVASIAIEKHI